MVNVGDRCNVYVNGKEAMIHSQMGWSLSDNLSDLYVVLILSHVCMLLVSIVAMRRKCNYKKKCLISLGVGM